MADGAIAVAHAERGARVVVNDRVPSRIDSVLEASGQPAMTR